MANWPGTKITFPKDECSVLSFIQTVEDSEPFFDFELHAREFATLLKLSTRDARNEANSVTVNYIEKIKGIFVFNPMGGLKLLTILCCNEQRATYPKSLKGQLIALLVECFGNSNMPQRAALEWGVQCWRNWPNRNGTSIHDELISPLLRLLIAAAEVEPDYALKIFNGLSHGRSGYGYVFNQFCEDACETARLGRALRNLEPRILIHSLQRLLEDGGIGLNGYLRGDEKIRRGATELYEILRAKIETGAQDYEGILSCLIQHAFPSEPWYFDLHELLWSIESQKESWDRSSLRNLALIAMNCGSNVRLRRLAENAFQVWANDFRGIDRNPKYSVIKDLKNQNPSGARGWISWTVEDDPVEAHARALIDTVSAALSEKWPRTRNRSFDAPEKCPFADHAITAYWALADWLQAQDPRLYFQVLVVGIENSPFPAKETEALSERASHRLIDDFEDFARTDIEQCAELIAFMISRSGYTDIGPRISKVLDITFPMINAIDKEAASNAFRLGKQFEQSHMSLWSKVGE